jgi:beta-mannosidase
MDGSERALDAADTTITHDAETILTLDANDLGDQDILIFRWTTSQGDAGVDLFAPGPFKNYDLLDPKLGHTVKKQGGKYVLTVTAEHLALFVTAEASQKGHFEQNALHVTPTQPVKITFVPNDPRHVPKFTFRDLYSATVAT